ncbi:MAG: hypothetical protein ACRD0W_12555 [Acidimicrobiales bacterium]
MSADAAADDGPQEALAKAIHRYDMNHGYVSGPYMEAARGEAAAAWPVVEAYAAAKVAQHTAILESKLAWIRGYAEQMAEHPVQNSTIHGDDILRFLRGAP